MQEGIKIVNKKCGQTPLSCIKELKNKDHELVNQPMTYAGRLDPLAEGVLIILVGDECLKKDEYLKLPKEYEVEILFGFATDTYDVMGLVTSKEAEVGPLTGFGGWTSAISKIIPNFIGKIKQNYPPYSSRPVKGKPLFQWAREGRLSEIEIPSHDVFIEKIEIMKENFIDGKKLLEKIKNDIAKVNGNFRQEEILYLWNNILKDKKKEKYKIIKLKISCGSGVYMRGIVNDLGKDLGIPALALNIIRTKVGEYSL